MLRPQDHHTSTMKELDATRLKDKEHRSRLSLFLTKSGSHENVSRNKKTLAAPKNISVETALRWSQSFEELLSCSDGVETFSQFLRTEFSEENIEFWLACEDYKTVDSDTKRLSRAKQIYTIFIQSEAPKEVNIDHATRTAIQSAMTQPTQHCFQAAQRTVFSLMKKDCYPRFLTSALYLRLSHKSAPGGAVMLRRRSRSCVFADRAEAEAASAW
ncbi:regulator of G-protein signaling 18 isoform X1 [Gadus macrocephalus]|uniref:regulator of G-protein signaling 18 isoform X1 n=1 Tax=Gadus macrocephalus TaxID=80720 RepID=UPI0028CBBD81|nr:regulator of G-protein signaling 18 isoform X1 [Gadus macrocephalus]